MFQSRTGGASRLPASPPWIARRNRQAPMPGEDYQPPADYEPFNGYSNEQLLKRFPLQTQPDGTTQQPPGTTAPAPSNNPFARENLSRTLLDIGSAFLSNDDFAGGLGAASQAIGGRMDDLRKLHTPKSEYGGPQNQFEIITNPDGTRTVRKVPEFAEAVAAERAAKNALNPKEAVDLRSRAIYSIGQLPQDQRAAAYRELMTNPENYGINTKGMPAVWTDTYGQVMGGMGQTVSQAEAAALRDQQFQHRRVIDSRRLDQGEQRIQQGAARVSQGERRLKQGGRRSSTPNYGSDLDY